MCVTGASVIFHLRYYVLVSFLESRVEILTSQFTFSHTREHQFLCDASKTLILAPPCAMLGRAPSHSSRTHTPSLSQAFLSTLTHSRTVHAVFPRMLSQSHSFLRGMGIGFALMQRDRERRVRVRVCVCVCVCTRESSKITAARTT
jgi:hypothetical protein